MRINRLDRPPTTPPGVSFWSYCELRLPASVPYRTATCLRRIRNRIHVTRETAELTSLHLPTSAACDYAYHYRLFLRKNGVHADNDFVTSHRLVFAITLRLHTLFRLTLRTACGILSAYSPNSIPQSAVTRVRKLHIVRIRRNSAYTRRFTGYSASLPSLRICIRLYFRKQPHPSAVRRRLLPCVLP